MTLVEFLLARIAEDEAHAQQMWAERSARRAVKAPVSYQWPTPDRTLAECAAKRRIVELFVDQVENYGKPWDVPEERLWPEYGGGYLLGLREAVQHLAVPYATHPDYRPEWAC